jgi:hypothetical protein
MAPQKFIYHSGPPGVVAFSAQCKGKTRGKRLPAADYLSPRTNQIENRREACNRAKQKVNGIAWDDFQKKVSAK